MSEQLSTLALLCEICRKYYCEITANEYGIYVLLKSDKPSYAVRKSIRNDEMVQNTLRQDRIVYHLVKQAEEQLDDMLYEHFKSL